MPAGGRRTRDECHATTQSGHDALLCCGHCTARLSALHNMHNSLQQEVAAEAKRTSACLWWAQRTSATPDAAAMAAALGCCVARGRLVTSSSSAAAMDSGDLPSHGCRWPPIGLLVRRASSAEFVIHVRQWSCAPRTMACAGRWLHAHESPGTEHRRLPPQAQLPTLYIVPARCHETCEWRRTCKAAGCHAAAWPGRWQDRWYENSMHACKSFTTWAKRGTASISDPAPAAAPQPEHCLLDLYCSRDEACSRACRRAGRPPPPPPPPPGCPY